jgi:hypothetical protein
MIETSGVAPVGFIKDVAGVRLHRVNMPFWFRSRQPMSSRLQQPLPERLHNSAAAGMDLQLGVEITGGGYRRCAG